MAATNLISDGLSEWTVKTRTHVGSDLHSPRMGQGCQMEGADPHPPKGAGRVWGLCRTHQREASLPSPQLHCSGSHTWRRRLAGSQPLLVALEWKILQRLQLKPNIRNMNCRVWENFRSWKVGTEITRYLCYLGSKSRGNRCLSPYCSNLVPSSSSERGHVSIDHDFSRWQVRMPQNSRKRRW